jgi:hypothetical protein
MDETADDGPRTRDVLIDHPGPVRRRARAGLDEFIAQTNVG